jgi:hypothetical protein
VTPLAPQIGDLWVMGDLPIAAEHLASEVILHALKGSLEEAAGEGPLLLASTLPGERHEWGILATLVVAQAEGWQCRYFGTDLPVDEMLNAAWTLRPAVVAFAANDPGIVEASISALEVFVRHLPPGVRATIGGRGAELQTRRLKRCGFRDGFGDPPTPLT